ncbi:protein DBF4 homolog A [Brienomyrus brachyistius]|uniref:protein DBF4 homolog A n=1 Tax=Brienomyrus brachyistius TaxID=42636 RepID=UPI0020B34BEB|nr:protein DBF4 homolog A [Brienomyrus brachyistius]
MRSRETADGGPNKASCKRNRVVKKSRSSDGRPLFGKCFYLHLVSNKKAESLEKDIRLLGGTVEKFFSKEIKYVVSDKKDAKFVQCLGRNSPVASPDSAHSSPLPKQRSPKGSSQGLTDAVVASRGKSLVERVIKEQERVQINRILSNALKWGVKILHVEDIISYVEKQKRNLTSKSKAVSALKNETKTSSTQRGAFQKHDAGRINRPFVKVEDCTRQYKPIYLSMPYLPVFNFTTTPPCTPFYVDDYGKGHGKKIKERRLKNPKSAGSQDGDSVRPLKVREKKLGGYCECCRVKYAALRTHLGTEHHKAFSKTDAYDVVDQLISGMEFDVTEIKHMKRGGCSVSSAVQVSVPKLALRDRREVSPPRLQDTGGGHAFKGASCLASTWEPSASCRPRKRSSEALPGGCGPKMAHSHRRERTRVLGPAVAAQQGNCPRHLAQSSTSDKTLTSASGQLLDNNMAVIGHNREETAVRKANRNDSVSLDTAGGLHLSCVVSRGTTSTDHTDAARTLQNRVQMARATCEAVTLCATSSDLSESQCPPDEELQRKVCSVRRRRKTVRASEGPVKNAESLSGVSWQLFQSSEDMEWDFKGFEI